MKDNSKAELAPLETVEDVYEIAVLLDFYGQLLTERQYEIMDLHYNSDLSLGEIAEDLGISRQGVHDSIRKAKQALMEYEKRLGLVERFRAQEKRIEKALESLEAIPGQIPEAEKSTSFQNAKKLLSELLDSL
ncbi:MAG: YlxM family DNA-binding protein [Clostridia bacterium]|nr:YlxM family DNA-binding protein [Clostridia bacterium]